MKGRARKGWLAKVVQWGWRRLLAGVKDRKPLTKAGGRRTGRGSLSDSAIRFRLHSGAPAPPAAPSKASAIAAATQARFQTGALFASLGECAARGAVFTALIAEFPGERKHLAALYPSSLADETLPAGRRSPLSGF